MAKRKRWQSALAGLGEGIGNASQLLLRQGMQDRYDAKIAARQTASADRQFTEELNALVAEGKIEPSQAQAMAQSRGITLNSGQMSAVQPTMRKRLGASLDKPLMDAKSPEDVPSLEDIASIGKGQGAFLPDEMMVPDARTDNPDPLLGASGELQEYVGRAETKRKSLMAKPTRRVDVMTPLGGMESVPTNDYSGPLTTKPDARTQGGFAGQQKTGELEVSGDALAGQAAKEAAATTQAKLTTENDPANVQGSAIREGALAGAASTARFPNDLKIAQARAKVEVEAAVNKENAINLIESTRASQQMRGFFDKFAELSGRVNTMEGVAGRVVGGMRAAQAAIGDDPDVREMQQLIAQNLRPLAVLMGVREANVSESETKQALAGIGVKPWSTHTEAVRALRNLQDVIDFAPIVAVRANTNAPIGDRMAMVSQMTQQRRTAEQEAIQGGFDQYIDPVTMTPRKVVK